MDQGLANLEPSLYEAEPGYPNFHQSYMCLHRGCEASFSLVELLEDHVKGHFDESATRFPIQRTFTTTHGLPNETHLLPPKLDDFDEDDGDRNIAVTSPTHHALGNASAALSASTTVDTSISDSDITASADNIAQHPTCTMCNQDFGRTSDLDRHAKKHEPGAQMHCRVAGCKYVSYRKDKMVEHHRRLHPSAGTV